MEHITLNNLPIVQLVDALVVDPIRRNLADSLMRFVDHTYCIEGRDTGWFTGLKATFCALNPTANSSKIAPIINSNRSNSFSKSKNRKGSAGNLKPGGLVSGSVTMSEFMTKYEEYCFNENIDMTNDSNEVKQRLITDFNLRPRGFIADRSKWQLALRH